MLGEETAIMRGLATGSRSSEGRSRFPRTRWTIIAEAGDVDSPDYRTSLEQLARLYWRPVYAYYRRKWGKSDEEAKDLTQDFFASLCEKEILNRLTPAKGRFRSYVMACLDNFVRLRHRSATYQKRGGGRLHLSLESAEGFEPTDRRAPEDVFQREWALSVLRDATAQMRAEYKAAGKEKAFQIFYLRDLNPSHEREVSYETLAKRYGLTLSEVSNSLFRARRDLRELIRQRIRETVTNEREVDVEMRELFGNRGV